MASKTPDGRVRIEPTITLGAQDQAPKKPGKDSASTISKVRSSKAAVSSTETQKSGSDRGVHSGLFAIVIGLILIISAGGGWYFFQQIGDLQSELRSSTNAMNVSTSQLENRLSSTDKSINQTGDKTSETLALLDSEIRKLWTIANKRNKGAIGENKKTTVALDKALAKVKKTADLAKNQLVQVKESNTLILATNKDLANTILSLNSTIAELEAQLGMQDSKLITLQQDLNKVAQQANLSDEVQSNAQAIQAIDAYRRQTNSSIEQLNQDIRNLYQRTAAEGTVSKPGL